MTQFGCLRGNGAERQPGHRRRRLLFVVGNPYIFDSAIAPLIEQLPPTIDVTVLAVNFFVPKSLRDRLETWRADSKISSYEFLPFFHDLSHRRRGPWASHIKCVRILRRLELGDMDLCVMHQTFTPWDRYVLMRVPVQCAIVLEASSNHFSCPEVVDRFRGGMSAWDALGAQEAEAADGSPRAIGRVRARLKRLFGQGNPVAKVRNSLSVRWVRFVDQVAAPLMLAGHTFRPTVMDRLTGMDTRSCQAMVVHQSFLAEFLRDLFPQADIYLTESPLGPATLASRAEPTESEPSVLLLMPFMDEHHVSRVLADLTRDLDSVRREAAIQTVVLRPHPRSPGDTTEEVRAALLEAGFEVGVDGSEPVWETVHRHAGVVGAATSSLLEAAHCHARGFVVGFTSLSLLYTENPRYLVGEIDGRDEWIGWIDVDGGYDPRIFSAARGRPPVGPAMADVIASLCMNPVAVS
ncbi:MAG: hypothetical protein U0904_11655 [Candidatus Nanopelagicales bacterium]|nr:hypothetical protein [Candidatus Nanopelagicales bacterium]